MVQENRFAFGDNWSRFLSVLNEERILQAELSLKKLLGLDSLEGLTFLDIGSGSGLFSLAAYRLKAKSVCSFDYDPKSVECTRALKRQFASDSPHWVGEQGDALNNEYLNKLGTFDIVFSWGVLHHTGNMWKALENVDPMVKDSGKLFISIYNDQGGQSRRWKKIKKIYNSSGFIIKYLIIIYTIIKQQWRTVLNDILRHYNPLYSWRRYAQNRGMSAWYDVIDWAGGYPFEVAKPEEFFHFYHKKGYVLENLTTDCGGIGCNQFVFKKLPQ